ncbi:Uncharacterized protein TPAR_08726 [Tolypocladium paradoxum]|uniref:HMG box domain-containing protein n=1 Tax=Tolypocladium paradoxum TaxID=94208 RepID=A0A2S4KLJ1_9HYPO|nr:Uncharacterized protein TPAR_08726 [Tolypocladium paradoxum]
MLTSIGRAAARRALASITTTTGTTKLAPRTVALHGALPVRSFSVSAWARAAPASTAKPAASKTKAKKKAPAKKKTKKTAAAAPKKAKKKKAPTPEEKEKSELRELKKMALLKGPTLLPDSAWSVYVSENLPSGQGTLTDKIKEVASRFGGLSESEKDSLRTTAQSNQVTNKQTRQEWIESHPPEAIYMANIARRRLGRKLNKSRVYLIHDTRLPKRAGTPYTLFIKSRFQGASDGGSASAQDAFRAMSGEWKAMSEADKKPFRDMAEAEVRKSSESLRVLKDKARAYWKEHKGGSSSQVPS